MKRKGLINYATKSSNIRYGKGGISFKNFSEKEPDGSVLVTVILMGKLQRWPSRIINEDLGIYFFNQCDARIPNENVGP